LYYDLSIFRVTESPLLPLAKALISESKRKGPNLKGGRKETRYRVVAMGKLDQKQIPN